LVLLGGGAVLFLLLLLGGAGVVGALYFLNRAPDAPQADAGAPKAKAEEHAAQKPVPKQVEIEKPEPLKKEIDKKPPPPVVGTAPWGTANLNELDAEVPIWDFAIRLPKNYDTLMGGGKIVAPMEASHYKWRLKGGMDHIDVTKIRMVGVDPVVLYKSDPLKSKPKDVFQFDTFRGPEEVHINKLPGARQWRWSTTLPPGGAVTVSYRFEIDGWHYVFNANAIGATREEAEARASLLDVSLCTFRKR
jgi:hypothetical protein